MQAQRRIAWEIVTRLTTTAGSNDVAEMLRSWHHLEEVFVRSAAMHGATGVQSAEAQVVIFTLFNESAYRHIRRNNLHTEVELERLRISGSVDAVVPSNRTVPPLPDDAVVLLTTWWPVARGRTTAMPVWDPESNPPRAGGNSYITWDRVVAVDGVEADMQTATKRIEFAGRDFSDAHRIRLDTFQHIELDRSRAERIMQDPLSRKAAVIALGRGLEAGDSLALVAMHVAAKRAGKWTWITLWWHDRPDRGPFAEDRPDELQGAWRNYLLDVALDPGSMTATDRGPDISFNPWLEARFPDTGSGGGTVSNCIACHQRASYPAVSFLPVTRGAPDFANDPAYSPGRVRTDQLWSLARRSATLSSKQAESTNEDSRTAQ